MPDQTAQSLIGLPSQLQMMSQPITLTEDEWNQKYGGGAIDYDTANANANQSTWDKTKNIAGAVGSAIGNNVGPIGGVIGGLLSKAMPAGAGMAASGILAGGAEAGKMLYNNVGGALGAPGADSSEVPANLQDRARKITDTVAHNMAGEGFARSLNALGELTAPALYRTLSRADQYDPKEMQGVQDAVERKIRLGLGQKRAIDKVKAPLNSALNDLDADNAGSTVNKTEWRRRFFDLYDPSKNPDAADWSQEKRDTATKVADNFLGNDKPDDIPIERVRGLKGEIREKVNFNDPEASAKTHAQKLLGAVGSQMQAAVDPEYARVNARLDHAINMEEVFKALANKPVTLPQYAVRSGLGGIAGGMTGYYTHKDPMTSAVIGAGAGAVLSPTVISRLSILARSLPAAEAASFIPRKSLGQINRDLQNTPGLLGGR